MTEKTPIDEAEEIAAARLLVADGWRPHTLPIRRGLDVRDWIDCVRVLLQRIEAAEKAADLSAGLMRAEVARRTALERQCIAILKAHGVDPHELGLRGDNER
jgi:uncharacterized protein YutE (UPF0331/DUF86 family)